MAWGGFFMATSAASGALLGLMIAAVTVRLTLIEGFPPIADRNYQLFIVLFDALVYSLVLLAPINRIVVSLVLVVFGIDAFRSFTFYCFHSDSSWRFSFSPASTVLMPEKSMTRFVQFLFSPFLLSRPLVILLAPIPLIVGGISLAARWGGGLYLSAFGLVLTLGYAVIFLWGFIIEPSPSKPIAAASPRAGYTRDNATVSAADEIKKLAELHAAGVLTDEEFAAKKKLLLGL
jgi:hypothetical protein